jgi:hypothetical protein
MSKKNGNTKRQEGFDTGDGFKVRDLELAPLGRKRIEWAESRMPVLMALREKYKKTKPPRDQGNRGPGGDASGRRRRDLVVGL